MNRQSPFRDTIFALSSGGLPSGVAVIRLSGPQVRNALLQMTGVLPPPRQAQLRRFRDCDGAIIDRGLVLFFPGPSSFTGEDCAEFQVHGGRAVVSGMLRTLGGLAEFRQAEAGEFSRRAFINGKMDLTGVEGLADLIAAETEAQRRLAIENVEGGQQQLYDGWRRRLLHARAMVEAELDFADEADVPGSVSEEIIADLQRLCNEIETHTHGFEVGEIVREGFKIVLVGAPNVGKSSLLNALARREVAIVTDVAGTTRDLIEVSLDLGGVKVVITDTAGIRETEDRVEKIGIERALSAAAAANLVLELIDSELPKASIAEWGVPVLRVATKSDLAQTSPIQADHFTSAATGEGLDSLVAQIAQRAQAATSMPARAIPTRARHVELLRATKASIQMTLKQSEPELKAEQLRVATDSLGKITGTVEVEELLGVIFSQFCIGK